MKCFFSYLKRISMETNKNSDLFLIYKSSAKTLLNYYIFVFLKI